MVFVQVYRAQHERILVEIYWFRMQEIVDGPRADLVALTEVLDANGEVDPITYSASLINCALTRSNSEA